MRTPGWAPPRRAVLAPGKGGAGRAAGTRVGGRAGRYAGKGDDWLARDAIDSCYADGDGSATLDLFDFLCFQNSFVLGETYACDCDTTTGTNPPVCDIFDFLCFQNAFVGGCP